MMTMIHLFMMWAAIAAVPQSVPLNRVIASTKEWKITVGDFEEILTSFPRDSRERFSIAANRRNLLDEVIRIWVLSNEARKNGMAVGTTYIERRNYYVLYAQHLGELISEDKLRTYYREHLTEYDRVHLSHILILNGSSPIIPPNVDSKKTRLPYDEALKKAQQVRAKLQAGEKFEELAKTYSDDPTSGPLGGEIGLAGRGQMPKELETAAFNLKVGEFSEVVGSVYGFHILRITEKKVLSFEELKDQIRQKLAADAVNADIDPKVKAAGVTIDETYFR